MNCDKTAKSDQHNPTQRCIPVIIWKFYLKKDIMQKYCTENVVSERRGSVGRGAWLVIERLQNVGLSLDTVACPWERHLMLFPTFGPSSLPDVVAQTDKGHANRIASVLEWYDDTGHRTTSGSNKEKEAKGDVPVFSTTKGIGER